MDTFAHRSIPQSGDLPQQRYLQTVFPEIEQFFDRYHRPNDSLRNFRQEIDAFTVRVPLVGAFSSGKTTLVNALLGEKIFAVEVDPKTTIPVELCYAPQEQFIGHKDVQAPVSLNRQQVKNQDFAFLLPNGWLQASLTAKNLEDLPHLTLVDMPGWDSGIDEHARAIDAYLPRSLAYCLVVSVDEGNLHDSLRNFLKELAIHKMPALLVITKSDKKPQTDVESVQKKVLSEMRQVLHEDPLEVVQVSARKQIQPFLNALQHLQQRVGERFHRAVAQPLLVELQGLEKHLETLANQENLDAEQISVRRRQLEQEMRQFMALLEQENQMLDAQIGPATRRIMELVRTRLVAQLDTLAHLVLVNGDLQGSLGQTVRLAISEGIDQEFASKLRRYFERLENEVPTTLNVSSPFNRDANTSSSSEVDLSGLKTVITTIMSAVTARLAMLGPVGLAIGAVLNVLVGLWDWTGGNDQESQAAQQREKAKQHILHSVIPEVISKISEELRLNLQSQLDAAKQDIMTATEARGRQHQQSLDQLAAELLQGQAAFEQVRQVYLTDHERLRDIMHTLLEKQDLHDGDRRN